MSTTKPIRRYAAAAAILAAAAVAAWQVAGRLGGGDGERSYSVVPAIVTDVAQRVTATGTLSAVVTVEVGSQVSGRIKELRADYNSEVEAGQVIAVIDPELFKSAVSQAKARLASSRAVLARAEATADQAGLDRQRAEKLGAGGLISDAQLDAARVAERSADASVIAAKADVTLARAALEQAQVNLEYTTIRSPISGVVVSRNVDVGQTVAASLSAPTLFVIAEDLRKMEVHTSLAESDVGQVSAGMRVDFTVDAFPDRVFQGAVKQVRYEAVTVQNVVTYDAVVRVDNDDLSLRPGMTANATFVVAERTGVLAVSNKALRYRPSNADWLRLTKRAAAAGNRTGDRARRGERDSHARTLWVLRGGAPVMVRAQVGLSDGANTEIVGGELAEGDQVIIGEGGAGGATSAAPAGQGDGGQRRGRRGPPRVL